MAAINFRYKNFTDQEKRQFENYFNNKFDRLEEWFIKFNSADIKMRVSAEKFSTKSAYKLTLDLRLPKNNFMASEDDHTITEVIDLTLDKLIIQLRKAINRRSGK